ncbi:hypothetical protein [Halotia branconii]|uniref:Uncharacterized protein n=1 Tax=Halotia branconii CENA392 TaxID=1539056 RepID=A0AAJ6PAG2_9CYAN|nr:hypothetical protein [Halotia branconii]WGV26760.1 hypothetical protein QI031_04430 [Halotia branconii CENA392]
MFIKQTLEKNLTVNRNTLQANRSDVKQEQVQVDVSNVPDVLVSLAPVGLLSSWVIFFLILRKIRTVLDNKMVFEVKGLHKVPCRNCQFYSNNNYLKCAVKPDIVMTEEAQDCSEYSPKKGDFSAKKFFK